MGIPKQRGENDGGFGTLLRYVYGKHWETQKGIMVYIYIEFDGFVNRF